MLLDDRDERPGVRLKDADLVGIPFRVNVGKKVTEDMAEVVQRSTRQSEDVSIGAIVEHFQQFLDLAHRYGANARSGGWADEHHRMFLEFS